MAEKLGKTLQEVQRGTTSREFIEWRVYLRDIRQHENEKIDHALAKLTAEVRRSWVADKSKDKIKDSDFLIVFEKSENSASDEVEIEETPEEYEERKRKYTENSKAFWLTTLGAIPGQKLVTRKAPGPQPASTPEQ